MECDVCGGQLKTDFLIDDVCGKGRRLACVRCLATSLEMTGEPIYPFEYKHPSRRWQALVLHSGSRQVEHGRGPFSQTLCGKQIDDDATRFRHLFRPNADDACDACSLAAAEADDLWPQGTRGRP